MFGMFGPLARLGSVAALGVSARCSSSSCEEERPRERDEGKELAKEGGEWVYQSNYYMHVPASTWNKVYTQLHSPQLDLYSTCQP
jgi:hypothetical protein